MKLKRLVSMILLVALVAVLASVPAMAASTDTLKTTASVNLRKGPSTSYSKITAVTSGKTFTYLGISQYDSNGSLWHKISYKKSTAWVSAKYSNVTVGGLKLDKKLFVKTTGSVNLRKGPGVKYAAVTSVPKGTKLFYMGIQRVDSNGRVWFKISSSKGILWVSSLYSNLGNKGGTGKTVITTGSVNMRKGPGTGYAKITAFSKGMTLTYLGQTKTDSRGNRWYKVSYMKYTGWMSSVYSKIQK